MSVVKDKRTSIYFDREKLQFVGLEKAQIEQLKDTYKGVDVEFELKKMGLWLNSSKGKKRKGEIGFIMNWLNNASPTQSVSINQEIDSPLDTPLRPYLDAYKKELCKGREHILEFNKIRKKS